MKALLCAPPRPGLKTLVRLVSSRWHAPAATAKRSPPPLIRHQFPLVALNPALSANALQVPADFGLAVELAARCEVDFGGWVKPDDVAGLAESRRFGFVTELLRVGGIGGV